MVEKANRLGQRDEQRESGWERRLNDADVRQSQKLESMGTLAGSVAHEINNPLHGILGYAELIQSRTDESEQVHQFAGEIIHEAERVASLVTNLLSFARCDMQQRAPARLDQLVESALSLIRAAIRHDQTLVTVSIPADLPAVCCNAQQIQQVLMNLLINARDALNEKYCEQHEHKRIAITARLMEDRPRPTVRITVADEGPGMSEEVLARIFEPFFTTKPQGQGTGLGLAVSRGIMQEHGGCIVVETDVGNGTSFHLELPVEVDGGSAPTSATGTHS